MRTSSTYQDLHIWVRLQEGQMVSQTRQQLHLDVVHLGVVLLCEQEDSGHEGELTRVKGPDRAHENGPGLLESVLHTHIHAYHTCIHPICIHTKRARAVDRDTHRNKR